MQLITTGRKNSRTQNNHIQKQIELTTACSNFLVNNSFTILLIRIENSKPVFVIEHSMNCSKLKGVVYGRRSGVYGPEMLVAADIEGCQVQWVIRTH